MPHIKLADLVSEATTVDLFGNPYKVLSITRSVQKKLEKIDAERRTLKDEEDGDKIVAVIAAGVDALLAPVEGAPPVKKALTDAWKADELSLAQLNALFEGVQEASVARPT